MRNQPQDDSSERKTQWKFGQNFLVDDQVIRSICDDLPSSPSDWIIEIGPGQGALTRRLLPRCRKLTALEIDPKWVKHLREKADGKNLEVLEVDAMRLDWGNLLDQHAPEPGQKPLMIGNLPYNRATPILLGMLPILSRCLIFQAMFQHEVAKRICAQPHSREFGFLSVMVQNYAVPALLRKISPEAFRPRPKVLSATLSLVGRATPICSHPKFQPFLNLAFSQKRKQLSNVMGSLYPKLSVVAALEAQGLRPDSRAEDVSVEGFAGIFAQLGYNL